VIYGKAARGKRSGGSKRGSTRPGNEPSTCEKCERHKDVCAEGQKRKNKDVIEAEKRTVFHLIPYCQKK